MEIQQHVRGKSAAKTMARVQTHPTTSTFVTTGIILAMITAMEFGIVYIEGMRTTVVAILFLLSVVKFVMVAGIFMHLKFDSRYLTWVFAVGVVLAGLITLALKFVNMA